MPDGHDELIARILGRLPRHNAHQSSLESILAREARQRARDAGGRAWAARMAALLIAAVGLAIAISPGVEQPSAQHHRLQLVDYSDVGAAVPDSPGAAYGRGLEELETP
ncbi:MAG: hypothetical protein V3T86_00185 [Planctomycetota bacterium]